MANPLRPRVRITVLGADDKPLRNAVVVARPAASGPGGAVAALPLHFDKEYQVFTGDLRDGTFMLDVSASGLESQSRRVQVADGKVRELFVLGTVGQPYYVRGKVRIPIPRSDLYGVAFKRADEKSSLLDLARDAGVDLTTFGITEHPVPAYVRRAGVRVYQVPPEVGPRSSSL